MNATARDFFQYPQADTKGMEDIFEVRELDANQGANQSPGRELARTVSVEEAAEKLGLSVRAVQKRLKKGSLAGFKKQTPQGLRWFVMTNELDANQDAILDGVNIFAGYQTKNSKDPLVSWRS